MPGTYLGFGCRTPWSHGCPYFATGPWIALCAMTATLTGHAVACAEKREATSSRASPAQRGAQVQGPSDSAAHVWMPAVHLKNDALSNQLESALELSRTLQVQHAAAQNTISFLKAKVNALESLVPKLRRKHMLQRQRRSAPPSGLHEEWCRGSVG